MEFDVNWLIQNMHVYVGEGSSRRNMYCKKVKGDKIYDVLWKFDVLHRHVVPLLQSITAQEDHGC